MVGDPRRRAARRAHVDGALHARGLRARRVQIQLRPARRKQRPAPVRDGRAGEHEGEHPACRRASPRLHALRRPAKRARRTRSRRNNKELLRTADALVRARMHTSPVGQQTDLLTRLVITPDPETGEFLDAETMRDQVLMHLSNGFNGPSITGAWLAYVLATYPEVEEKMIAEIDGITGGDPDYDLQWDDLMGLTYTT